MEVFNKHRGTFGLLWQSLRWIGSFYKQTKLEPYISDIKGSLNDVIVKSDSDATRLKIYIRGNNNKVIIGKDVSFGADCIIRICGNNHAVKIGDRTSFNIKCGIVASENEGTEIIIGEDCLFSYGIIVRSSDDHAVYDLNTGERLNPAKSIRIGNHVWVGPEAIIMKGVVVDNGAIIGARSIVTHDIPSNCMAVGAAARIVKNNICWSEEMLSNIF